eukprot:1170646-Pleurochrysis_carterae.AAC.1
MPTIRLATAFVDARARVAVLQLRGRRLRRNASHGRRGARQFTQQPQRVSRALLLARPGRADVKPRAWICLD